MLKKSRANPLKFLTMFMLLITLLFIPTAHAGYNGNKEDVDPAGGVKVETVYNLQNARKGYRFYAVREDGQRVSDIRDLWFGEGTLDEVKEATIESEEMPRSKYFLYSRAALGYSTPWSLPLEKLCNESGTNQIPEPFSSTTGQGDMLKSWIYATEDGEELCNGLRIIRILFGSDVVEQYINNESDEELYIIIETLVMVDILDKYDQRVGVFAGSAYNWGTECGLTGQPYGNQWLRRETNGVLALSLLLEETWEDTNIFNNMEVPTYRKIPAGTPAKNESAWIGREMLHKYGYGTHEYTFSSLMTQTTHTWDHGLGATPGPAPKVEDDKEDKVTIVKVYCTKDSETGEIISWDGSFIRKENPRTIEIEDEPEYKVEEWKTLKAEFMSAPSTWYPIEGMPAVQGPSNGTGTVKLDPDKPTLEKTLCVLLTKQEEVEEVESDLIIQESEISIYRQMSEVNDFNLPDRKIKWLTDGIPSQVCDYEKPAGDVDCGRLDTCPDGPGEHKHPTTEPCGETVITMVDKSLKFKAKNTTLTAYKNILATEAPFKPEVVPKVGYSYSKTTPDPESKQYEFDYKFVVYRGSDSTHGKDDLTLSDYTIAKESLAFDNSPVKALDKSEGTTPGTRKRWAQTEKASIDFPVNLKITLKQDDSGDYRFSGKLKCGHQSAVSAEFRTNEEILAEAPVTIHSYSGKPKTPSRVSGSPQSYVPGCHKGNGYVVNDENLTLSFYPYIRMTYETMGSNAKHDVNVLSQHKREMTVSDYAEAGYVNGGQTLSIQSQQWSVHQLATKVDDDHPWAGRNKVLPGGAIYNVKGHSSTGQTLLLRTYQVVVGNDVDAGAYKALVAAGSTGLADHTVAKAEAAHQAFVESCLAVVNNGYYIEQVINNDPMAELSSLDGSGWTVVNRDVMSAESKYYLNNTSESVGNIQSAILQATAHAPTKKLYTFYSDTSGNVYMDGTLLLEKGEGISKLPSGNAKEINKRTKVVTNLIGAIERNTGDDPTASWVSGEEDGAWYNEAFSVTILVQETSINVNLTNPTKRETVLDPKLCPTNSGKSDYFSKARASAYRMSSTSILAESLGKGAGYIGTFKETDISISNITGMLRSNPFIIPNVNVQDLKD